MCIMYLKFLNIFIIYNLCNYFSCFLSRKIMYNTLKLYIICNFLFY